jgi:hypothetical protein
MVSYIRGDDDFDSSEGGGSTDWGAVGSYGEFNTITNQSTEVPNPSATTSGSNLTSAGGGTYPYGSNYTISGTSYAVSGTWRLMGNLGSTSTSYVSSIFCRVS